MFVHIYLEYFFNLRRQTSKKVNQWKVCIYEHLLMNVVFQILTILLTANQFHPVSSE